MACVNQSNNFHFRSFKNPRSFKSDESEVVDSINLDHTLMNSLRDVLPEKVRVVLQTIDEVRQNERLAKVLFPSTTIGSITYDTRSSEDTTLIFYTLEKAIQNLPNDGFLLVMSDLTPRTFLLTKLAENSGVEYETDFLKESLVMSNDQYKKVILDIIQYGFDPIEVLNMDLSEQLLNELEIDEYLFDSDQGVVLTTKGDFVSKLPIQSLKLSTMVYHAYDKYSDKEFIDNSGTDMFTLETCIAVASMIETEDEYFYIPDNIRNDNLSFADLTRRIYDVKFRGETTVHTYSNIYWDYMKTSELAESYDTRAKSRDRYSYLLDWSVNNYIIYENFKRAENLITRTKDVLMYNYNIPFMNREMKYEIKSIGGLSLYGSRAADIFRTSFSDDMFNRVLLDQGDSREIIVYSGSDAENYEINLNTTFNTETYPNTIFGYVNPITSKIDIYVGEETPDYDDYFEDDKVL